MGLGGGKIEKMKEDAADENDGKLTLPTRSHFHFKLRHMGNSDAELP